LKRREFITLLGGATAAWPLGAGGQELGRIYRVGALIVSPRDAPHHVAFFDELRRLGFIDGQNLAVDVWLVTACPLSGSRGMRPIW
jgi:putative tryptophan/tyrosine transport system substrate-binding protein